MLIRQENGKGKIGWGVSLKDPNKTGIYYCYVWDKRTFDYEEVKRIRQTKGTNNFSKMGGFKSLGRYGNPATFEKLYIHLVNVYGIQFDTIEVQEHLKSEYLRLEKIRKEKLILLNTELQKEYALRGIKNYSLADTVKGANKKLKSLKGV